MKYFAILIFITFILKPILPFVDYVVNYEYISKALCENKTKPELKCNGKCHLMKELAKASDGEKPLNSDKKNSFTSEIEVLYCTLLIDISFRKNLFSNRNSISDWYKNLYCHSVNCSVFHPPILFLKFYQ